MQFNGLRNVNAGKLSVLPNTGNKQKRKKVIDFKIKIPTMCVFKLTKIETVKKRALPNRLRRTSLGPKHFISYPCFMPLRVLSFKSRDKSSNAFKSEKTSI